MKPVLLDTGPLVALLDRSEPDHPRVRATMAALRAPLLTTSAVLTEAFHFVTDIPGGPRQMAEFVRLSGVEVRDCFARDALDHCVRLMEKYSDTPMDFADATLVWLAAQVGSGDILTLDRRGFSTYRFARNRRFRLLLED